MTLNKKNFRWIPTVHRLLTYGKAHSKRARTGVLLRFIRNYTSLSKKKKKSEETPLYLKHDSEAAKEALVYQIHKYIK